MKEKTVYICECCGEVFNDFDACNCHEMEELAVHCKYDFQLYDEHGPIIFKPELNPGPIVAIACSGDEETINLIDRYYSSHAWDAPPMTPGKENLWIFDERTCDWCNINETLKHYQDLKDKYSWNEREEW